MGFDVILAAGRPPVARVDCAPDELGRHRPAVEAVLAEHGSVLLRGVGVADPGGAAAAARALTSGIVQEQEPFAPRSSYAPGIYSSTEWPPDQPMCMHHELSYALTVPSRQVFSCLRAPAEGGAVALADGAAVLAALPADLVARFEEHGWQLRRTYNGVVGLDWPAAFGTSDPATVESYCKDNDIEFSWAEDGSLRTRRHRPAVIRHPGSGRRIWFNQIAFLNEWTMDPAIREYLTFEFGPEGLPFTTFCGDGSPLDPATVDAINAGYDAHTVREPWQAGDVLVVDNLRTAHSRDVYRGEREVVVTLADPVRVSRS